MSTKTIEITKTEVYRDSRGTDTIVFYTELSPLMPALSKEKAKIHLQVAANTAEAWLLENFGMYPDSYVVYKFI